MSKKSLLKIIGVVTILNIVSRLFGFLREAVIGYHFGTSSLADSVILAYTIPTFIYLVVGGAITTAFISIYKKVESSTEQQQFKELVFTYTTIAMAVLSLLFVLLSREITDLLFSGLTAQESEKTARLFAIMAPSTLFLVISMWFSGLLNIHDRFFGPAFSTLVNNAGFVLLAVLFYPFMGAQAYGWGALLGSVLMVLLLVRELRRNHFLSFRFRFAMENSEYAKRMLKVGVPILFGGATLQFYFLLHRMFASQLAEGAVAALNYASKLVQLPQVILMTAVTTVIYPTLAAKVANGRFEEVAAMYDKGLRLLLVTIIPISIFIFIYAYDLVKLVFEYGSFTAESTAITAELLQWFVIGMFAHAANVYVTRFFYAMEKSLYPVISGVIAVFGINVGLILLWIEKGGADAIALATTISAYAQLFFLLIASRFVLKLTRKNFTYLTKYGIFFVLLALALYGTSLIIHLPMSLFNAAIGFIVFIIFVLVFSKVCRIAEIEQIFKKMKKSP
ncbi:murein biosynthesis integral membrane protein MurJ [Bacillus songklensis]|uniref:Probable lipid II flippase MurJ n=1 Tax=Bacillus songklensis TaxID=1069116 RepID=A0ABV8BAH2_9BACI